MEVRRRVRRVWRAGRMSKVEGDGSGGGPAGGGAGVEDEVMWKDGLLAGGWGVEVLDICDGGARWC